MSYQSRGVGWQLKTLRPGSYGIMASGCERTDERDGPAASRSTALPQEHSLQNWKQRPWQGEAAWSDSRNGALASEGGTMIPSAGRSRTSNSFGLAHG